MSFLFCPLFSWNSNCKYGIYWRNSASLQPANATPYVCVENNTFSWNIPTYVANYGIIVAYMNNKKFLAYNNHINTIGSGIRSANNVGSTIWLKNNDFQNPGINNAIEVLEQSSNTNNIYDVEFNHIWDCDLGFNIVNNVTNTIGNHLFQNNDINFSYDGTAGFQLNNSQMQSIMCNHVVNYGSQYYSYAGVSILGASPGNLIDGNNFELTATGVQVQANQTQTYLTANYFNQDLLGIWLYNKAYIGHQGNVTKPSYNIVTKHWANSWTLPTGVTGAYATESDLSSNVTTITPPRNQGHIYTNGNDINYPFYYFSGSQIYRDLNISNSTSDYLDFVNPLPNNTSYNPAACNMLFTPANSSNDGVTEADITLAKIQLAALDTTHATDEAMNTFFRQLALYKQVMAKQTMLDEDEDLQAFWDAATDPANLESYNLTRIADMENEISLAFDSAQLSLSDTNRVSHLRIAIYLNSQISTNIGAVNALKTVNAIYLPLLQADTIPADSTVDISTLISIANLCPEVYGPAVYNARHALIYLGYENTYNDELLCGNSNERKAKGNTINELIANANKELAAKNKIDFSNDGFALYPNPAKDEINFAYKAIELNSKLVVFDYTGKQLMNIEMGAKTEGTTTVNLSQFNSGLYLYKIVGINGTNEKQGKFTVTK